MQRIPQPIPYQDSKGAIARPIFGYLRCCIPRWFTQGAPEE
jgi:hypothetical protein